MSIKTPDQVKQDFENKGQTVSAWAEENGYAPQDVYKVLNGQAKCKRGKGHQIAVSLGIKSAPINA
ncbi:DNA-binding protein [Acinetobacter beijerinckii]|uniref:DNA-binding protein n=1 Tax=Acinetobacter beijerinckii TaxID=262668 RepID=UPI0024072F36|nr:DNA-binding protein [Acinetobacter beijerinckii]